MNRQPIKDNHFHTVGYIDTDSSGKQTAKDAHFRTLGYYDPTQNVTKDAHFRTIGYGNLLASLIWCD